jgi:hypothetical protein
MSDTVQEPVFQYARDRIARFLRLEIDKRLAAASLARKRTLVVENGLSR